MSSIYATPSKERRYYDQSKENAPNASPVPMSTPTAAMAISTVKKKGATGSQFYKRNSGNQQQQYDSSSAGSTDATAAPPSAQATIAQLQESWAEAMTSPQPTSSAFRSTRLGQWVQGQMFGTVEDQQQQEQHAEIPDDASHRSSSTTVTSASTVASSSTTTSSSSIATHELQPPPSVQQQQQPQLSQEQIASMKRRKALIYQRYGDALEQVRDSIHQVVVDDDLFRQMQAELRAEGVVTNAVLRNTCWQRLLVVQQRRLAKERALAAQLQAMNQANEQLKQQTPLKQQHHHQQPKPTFLSPGHWQNAFVVDL